ncbi:diaminopimelate epimerase [Pilimelia columellifera]|uniref:Diaminopimelate epimerase n=1 Tax=Pilimelia columellifera subsp. columellifera TaxID=706583 RepID=A0ABP6AEL6_9ACTN
MGQHSVAEGKGTDGVIGIDGVPFAKGHGAGNDFVILPDPDGALPLTAAQVAALCDRRRGIGGDGLLRVVRSAKHPDAVAMAGEAEWFMDYWNADGTQAEMCGNGVRVFARYLIESGLVGWPSGDLRVATRSGVVPVRDDAAGLAAGLAPPRLGGPATAAVAGRELDGVAVDCGNPHLVCALPDAEDPAVLDLTAAPTLDPETFPTGANVEFVAAAEPVDGADLSVRMRVHERGVGETLSCGSGACAVAAAALADTGRDTGVVAVHVPGGRLTVTVADEACWLAGPAVIVAAGVVHLG